MSDYFKIYQDIDRRYIKQDAEDEWRRVKWGKFSASEIDNLMTPGKGRAFSDGAMAYIERIAREAYTTFNDDENNETWAMRRGKMKEPEAFNVYRHLMGRDDFVYYGGGDPYFEHYCEDSGASPDCLLWKDRGAKIVLCGAEFKCPTSKVHWDYLRNIKTQWDLKEINSGYYGQCQFGMMTFKTNLWHWCSYNEYYPLRHRMRIIEIEPDFQYQSNLKIRLLLGKKEKYHILAEMNAAA